MCSNGTLICVNPAIPNKCLNNLAGWLLGAMLFSEPDEDTDAPATLFFAEGEEKGGDEIDEDFQRYFAATDDSDPLKLALIKENEDLTGKDGLVLGKEIDTFALDLDDVIQRVVVESRGDLSVVELTVLYTAGIVRPGNIGGYCSFITADDIASLSYEDWLSEQRERFSEVKP